MPNSDAFGLILNMGLPKIVPDEVVVPEFLVQKDCYTMCQGIVLDHIRSINPNSSREELEDAQVFCEHWERFTQTGSREDYLTAARFAKDEFFSHVVDIGCGLGCQSPIFVENGMQYIGIDNNAPFFCEEEDTIYFSDPFPFNLSRRLMTVDFRTDRVLGISRHCLGEGLDCYEDVAKQFNDFLFSGPKEAMEALARFYDQVTPINDWTNRMNPENCWFWLHGSTVLEL